MLEMARELEDIVDLPQINFLEFFNVFLNKEKSK